MAHAYAHDHGTMLMPSFALAVTLLAAAVAGQTQTECGEFGFLCDGRSRLRLCGGPAGRGRGAPAFLCPRGLVCSERSPVVCEPPGAASAAGEGGGVRCQRPGREADRSVPGCKGYVLCVRRGAGGGGGAGYSALRLLCPGDTLFNGVTRTCTSPAAYRCPLPAAAAPEPQLYQQADAEAGYGALGPRPVDCKDYKLAAGAGAGGAGAAYFCPARPARVGAALRCTVFSDHFCLILERDDQDQFAPRVPTAPRRPRAPSPPYPGT